MADRLVEFSYKPGEEVVIRFRPPDLRDMLPAEAAEHYREAGKEMLLGMRSMIDLAVHAIEKKDTASAKGKTKIKVE